MIENALPLLFCGVIECIERNKENGYRECDKERSFYQKQSGSARTQRSKSKQISQPRHRIHAGDPSKPVWKAFQWIEHAAGEH
jgi:hypothetical protein